MMINKENIYTRKQFLKIKKEELGIEIDIPEDVIDYIATNTYGEDEESIYCRLEGSLNILKASIFLFNWNDLDLERAKQQLDDWLEDGKKRMHD